MAVSQIFFVLCVCVCVCLMIFCFVCVCVCVRVVFFLEKEWQPTPTVLLPGNSPGQRSLVGYSPWGRKESDMAEQLYLLTCLLFVFLQY